MRTLAAASILITVAMLLAPCVAHAIDPIGASVRRTTDAPRAGSRFTARLHAVRSFVRRRGPVASVEREHLQRELGAADAELARADAALRAEPSHAVLAQVRDEAGVADAAWYASTAVLRQARAAYQAAPTEPNAEALHAAQAAERHAAGLHNDARQHVITAHEIFRRSPAARRDREARARRHDVAVRLEAHGAVVTPAPPWPFADEGT